MRDEKDTKDKNYFKSVKENGFEDEQTFKLHNNNQLDVHDLSLRKLPSTVDDLIDNFGYTTSVAEFLNPYLGYDIVNPDGIPAEDVQRMLNGEAIGQFEAHEIPFYVLSEMFLSVTTNSGKPAYSSIALEEIQPGDLTRLQTYVFQDKMDAMGKEINQRYSVPSIILDHRENQIAIYVPPIVEKHHSEYVLIDGTHRGYIAHQNGERILVVVAEPLVELPAKPIGTIGEMNSETDVVPTYIPTGGFDSLDRPKFYNLRTELFRMYNLSGFGKFDTTKPAIDIE